MLAMRDDEVLVTLLAIAMAVVALRILLQARSRAQESRQRLLELALQHQALDSATKERLLAHLTEPRTFGLKVRTLAGLGWIGIFVGIGCMLAPERDANEAGPIVALVSFGVLSLPFALRELESRRGAERSRA